MVFYSFIFFVFKSPGNHFPGDSFYENNSGMCSLLDIVGITFINPSHFFLINLGKDGGNEVPMGA